ncbi:MAG: RidA family protein [Marinirhabdus sp.]|nr:RidA family protein [Marinirhabdus sp.]
MRPYKHFIAFLPYSLFLIGCGELSEKNTTESNDDIEATITITETPVFHQSHEAKKENAPFSDVVQVGNTYYLAGQIGMDHTVRELVSGGIVPETKQALENIKAVLSHHRLSMADVVKATVILDNIEDFQAFNEIYVEHFPQKPARTTFAAEALAANAAIEIEVVAVRKE